MTCPAEAMEIGQAARPAFQGQWPAMLGGEGQYHLTDVPLLGGFHLTGLLKDGSIGGYLRLGEKDREE
jgi:hypothetical protein